MKLILIRSNLKEGLSAVERATGGTSNLPILKHVLLEASGGRVTLTATNLELAVRAVIAGKAEGDGALTIPADIFSNLVGNLPSERLELRIKDNKLEIVTDNYHGVLTGSSREDFPIIPKIEDDSHYLEVEGGILKEALAQAIVATQVLELRPELGSVLVDFSIDAFKFAATDSFRLAERTLFPKQFTPQKENPFRALLPLKAAQELVRIIKNDETVKIYHDQSQMFFMTPSVEFVSRLVEGNFPDYSAVVSQEFTSKATVNRQELMNAVRLASVLGGRTHEAKLSISKEKSTMQVSSSDQAAGENTYSISGKISGEDATVAFNWRYLLDGLKVLKTEDVFIGFYQDNRKAFIKDSGEGNYFYILASLV